MDLKRWTQRTYISGLDELTAELLEFLGANVTGRALEWGGCRKCVNIFLCKAMYNRYLAREYELDRLVPDGSAGVTGMEPGALLGTITSEPFIVPH
ncbi:hypothetical protein [Ralstonia solanacearum]|uniref:hypothetical protein n=1 Tax=Ralstonia solanacearum TaxID=305 RepID=UPI001E4AC6D0|nr:hypothetical protein [Ralstonia solanacearum]